MLKSLCMYIGRVVFDFGHNNFLSHYLVLYVDALCSESHKNCVPFQNFSNFLLFCSFPLCFTFLSSFKSHPPRPFWNLYRRVVTYPSESWTMKNAECQRNDAFILWCWRRPLRVPRTARKSNRLILKEKS